MLALEHVIAVRNPFKLFLDFLLAFGWGLPIALLAFLSWPWWLSFEPGQLAVRGGSCWATSRR